MSKKELLKQLIEKEIIYCDETLTMSLPKFLRKIRDLGLCPYVKINKKGDVLGFYIKTRNGNQSLGDYIGNEYGWKIIKKYINYDKTVHADKIILSNLNMTLLN